jgi:hypothetical protein
MAMSLAFLITGAPLITQAKERSETVPVHSILLPEEERASEETGFRLPSMPWLLLFGATGAMAIGGIRMTNHKRNEHRK